MVGFPWTIALKWPYSIGSLFLRRCVLSRASFVAVCVRRSQKATETVFDKGYIQGVRGCFTGLYTCLSIVMSFVFSDANTFGIKRHEEAVFEICNVHRDVDGTPYFVFQFRRYILDGDKFVPGELNTRMTIESIIASDGVNGLTDDQVSDSRRIVGRNMLYMSKPNILRTLWKEVSKPFYTYQVFLIWTVSSFHSLEGLGFMWGRSVSHVALPRSCFN